MNISIDKDNPPIFGDVYKLNHTRNAFKTIVLKYILRSYFKKNHDSI